MSTTDRAALERRWRELTGDDLPARARAERWALRLDHCFMRVLLDDACGGRWYDHVEGRPAYRHLDDGRLERAVATGEELLAADDGAAVLERLDAQSLRWRGKPPKRRSAG